MLVNLKVNMDAETGNYYEAKAILIGNDRAVYTDDAGILVIEKVSCVNGHYETDVHAKSLTEIHVQDPTLLEQLNNMSALEFLAIC